METTGIMKMFMLMAEMGAKTEEEKVEAQASIVFRTPGIIKPEGWAELPLAERKRRIELLKGIA